LNRLFASWLAAARATWAARQPWWASVLAPLVIVLALAPWLAVCAWNYCQGYLNRDAMMFLYAAWSVLHGERLYGSLAIPDGPFACVLHILLYVPSGTSEHGFRVVDLLLQSAGAFTMGAVVVPRRARAVVASRVVWGLVAAAMWLTTIFHWAIVDANQREIYYSLFEGVGFALLIASGDVATAKRERALLVTAGVLLGLPWFGKQTHVVYPLLALAAVALEGDAKAGAATGADGGEARVLVTRWRRVRWLLTGIVAAGVAMLLFVVLFGSVRGYIFWQYRYSLGFYPYYERAELLDVLLGAPKDFATLAIVCLVGGSLAVARGLLPRRALGFAVASFVAMFISVIQSKGWSGYYIPALQLGQAFLVYAVIRAWHAAPRARDRHWSYALAVGLAAFVVLRALDLAQNSPWLDKAQRTADDPKVLDTRRAAEWLHDNTGPDDRVIYYGHEPQIPFLAQRKPGSPVYVEWELCTRWYHASREAEARIRQMHREVSAQLCQAFTESRARAIAISDLWCHEQNCDVEIREACPEAMTVMQTDYLEPKRFGANRIYMRR
jgi:hypothetical protein